MAESAKGEQDRAMRIDPALVRELAELLTDTGLTDIEIEDGDRKIRVSRAPAPLIQAAAPVAVAPAAAAAPAAAPADAAGSSDDLSGQAVKSPMVGTAFLSPEPGAAPFVSVGSAVKSGDTLLIVEAMKVMNPIIAPSDGIVRKIMVSDGHPVEFDQPLVVLD